MALRDTEDLVDKIYEAAIVRETWNDVLQDIGDIAGARGAILLTANPTGHRWMASPDLQDFMMAYEESHWHQKNVRLERALAMQHAGFMRDVDLFSSPEEVQNDPQVKHFIRKHGLGWGVGTIVPVPSGDFLVLSIEREFERGPVEAEAVPRLDVLRPHLARAALLTARLGLERARAATSALSLLGLPGAVLRFGGSVMAANAEFEHLIPSLLQDRRDRLSLTSPATDLLLQRAIIEASHSISGDVKSIPIAATDGHPPTILHLLPVRRAAADIFVQASAIVILTPVVPANVPTAQVLQGLFDLTPAESRIARHVGMGQTIDEVADALGVSRETVRTHLKAVLAKTGVGRQAELVGLLSVDTLPMRQTKED